VVLNRVKVTIYLEKLEAFYSSFYIYSCASHVRLLHSRYLHRYIRSLTIIARRINLGVYYNLLATLWLCGWLNLQQKWVPENLSGG
jgi:hypothetical protein